LVVYTARYPKNLAALLIETHVAIPFSILLSGNYLACLACFRLYPAHEDQNENHDQQQSDTAARSITPAAAVTPGRNHANQRQDQHNQNDHPDAHLASPCFDLIFDAQTARMQQDANRLV
jgi:hypothetical protein